MHGVRCLQQQVLLNNQAWAGVAVIFLRVVGSRSGRGAAAERHALRARFCGVVGCRPVVGPRLQQPGGCGAQTQGPTWRQLRAAAHAHRHNIAATSGNGTAAANARE